MPDNSTTSALEHQFINVTLDHKTSHKGQFLNSKLRFMYLKAE